MCSEIIISDNYKKYNSNVIYYSCNSVSNKAGFFHVHIFNEC